MRETTSDDAGSDRVCENCNTHPRDVKTGHSYTTTDRGIAYDLEHLGSLGFIRENGVVLLFDRMNNRLLAERDERSVQELLDELQRRIGTEGDQ